MIERVVAPEGGDVEREDAPARASSTAPGSKMPRPRTTATNWTHPSGWGEGARAVAVLGGLPCAYSELGGRMRIDSGWHGAQRCSP